MATTNCNSTNNRDLTMNNPFAHILSSNGHHRFDQTIDLCRYRVHPSVARTRLISPVSRLNSRNRYPPSRIRPCDQGLWRDIEQNERGCSIKKAGQAPACNLERAHITSISTRSTEFHRKADYSYLRRATGIHMPLLILHELLLYDMV